MTRNFVGARGIEAIFTTTTSGTTTAFPLYDCHGNMVATVARSGAGFVTSNVRTYDVWGGVRTGANTGGPKGRYVANLGHVQDDESGLIYMRARYYEPESGRFISEDPARDGLNFFLYAENAPVTYVDRNGEAASFLWVGLCVAIIAEFNRAVADGENPSFIRLIVKGANSYVSGVVTEWAIKCIISVFKLAWESTKALKGTSVGIGIGLIWIFATYAALLNFALDVAFCVISDSLFDSALGAMGQ